MEENKRSKGTRGEELAQKYLIKQGFKILESPFACRTGEVDIVAKKDSEIYFVEVKTRWSLDYGDPLESITYRKQKKLISASRFYLAKKGLMDTTCHLSAMGIDMTGNEPKIEFIEDAFEV